jgi:tripartite-type tricarboxylate transporter receptor subunit TctC
MDPKIVQILHDAFKKSLDDPETIAVLDKFFMVPNYADQKGYLEIIKQTTAYEKQALERIGLAK